MSNDEFKITSAAKHISLYGIGTISRQIAGFIMLPIYTRYLTPADYGVIALLTLSLAIIEVFLGARFGPAMQKFYYEKDKQSDRNKVISTTLFISVAFSITGYIIVLGLSDQLSSFIFGSIEQSLYVEIFSIILFTTVVEQYGFTFIRLQEKPLLFLVLSLIKLAVQLVLNVVCLIYLDLGVMGVVISSVITTSLFCVGFGYYVLREVGGGFDQLLGRRLFKFSWPLWIAGLASLYEAMFSRYFIRIFGGLEDVGLFALALRFASLQTTLIRGPFNQWWQTERFKLYQRPDRGIHIFRGVFLIYFSVLCFSVLGISVFSGIIIQIMADPSFHSASQIVSILALGILLQNISTYANFSFHITEKTKIIMYIRYFNAIIITILYVIFIRKYGYVGAGIAIFITALVGFYITYILANRLAIVGISIGYFHLVFLATVAVVILDHFVLHGENIWHLLGYKVCIVLVYGVFLVSVLLRKKDAWNIIRPVVSNVNSKLVMCVAKVRNHRN